jgi:thiol-disulfide isomerase/thioredoxin
MKKVTIITCSKEMKTFLVIVGFLFIQGTSFTQSLKQPIPEFKTFDALAPSLTRNNDTTYVINFWATWCKPCVKEMPYFQELHKMYQGKPLKIILVSLDMRKELDSRLRKFVDDHQLSGEVVALTDVDHNSWIPRVDESWTGAIPATLIRKGSKSSFLEGEWDDLNAIIAVIKSIQ